MTTQQEFSAALAAPINAAYQEVLRAEETKLGCAINGQGTRPGQGRTKRHNLLMPEFVEKYCPGISYRTARVYMQLADSEGKLTDAVWQRAANSSIRRALEQITKPAATEPDKAEDQKPEEEKAGEGTNSTDETSNGESGDETTYGAADGAKPPTQRPPKQKQFTVTAEADDLIIITELARMISLPHVEPDVRIARIRLSDKSSRLHPRHVVPKPAQAYEPEMPVDAVVRIAFQQGLESLYREEKAKQQKKQEWLQEQRTEWLNDTAFHEAGHAVAFFMIAEELGYDPAEAVVRIKINLSGSGHVLPAMDYWPKNRNYSRLCGVVTRV
jgi:hypothetical protein